MHWGYSTLYSRTPCSFVLAVVANIGPGRASCSLAVAYRQQHKKYNIILLCPVRKFSGQETKETIKDCSGAIYLYQSSLIR